MVQASNVLMGYFIIAAVMWGGGAIAFDQAGVVGIFVGQADDGVTIDDTAGSTLQSQGNIIQQTAALAVGGLVFAINLLVNFFNFLNWPLTVLLQANAPPSMVVLLGGSFTSAFYLSMLSIVS